MDNSDEYYKMKYLKYKAKYQEALSRQKGGNSFAAGPPANLQGDGGNSFAAAPLAAAETANLQGDDGISLLMSAAIQNNQLLITRLIAAGANLDLQDNDGNTALMHAIDKMNKGIAIYLISSGANVTIKNQLFKKAKDIALNRAFNDLHTQLLAKEGIYNNF
jgi:ankyrin repeat protein